MHVSDEYIESVRDWLSSLGDLRIRKMFGGAMLFHHDLPFAIIADDVLYLKTDDRNRPDFESAGMPLFQPFPDKPMKMPYSEIPAEVLESRDELTAWVEKALAAARRAPGKKKRKTT